MAKLLYRESTTPPEPTSVSGGSASKGTPLTNEEGDWNFFALNTDLATKAPIISPSFTGVVSFDKTLKTSGFDLFEYSLNGTIGTTGVLIGSVLLTNNDNAHYEIRVAGTSGVAGNFGIGFAQVAVRSGTMPTVDGRIFANSVSVAGVSVKIEAWKATSDGKVYFYAVPSETLQSLFITVKASTRSNSHAFTPVSTITAKSISGQTQFAGTVSVDFTGYEVKGNFTGDMAGNAATTTKLVSPRNINGTVFDGTSNITTNSWGTLRNVTIGNKTLPVDGSANVSWTLADMGAQPAVVGKQLSTEDYTTAEKSKLGGIEAGAVATATLSDSVSSSALPAVTPTSIGNLLQTVRNCLKWLVGEVDIKWDIPTGSTNAITMLDRGKAVTITANTSIPPNSSVPFPIGTSIMLIGGETGRVITGPAEASLIVEGVIAARTTFTMKPNKSAIIRKTGTDTWRVFGDVIF